MINHFAVFMFEGVVSVQCRAEGQKGALITQGKFGELDRRVLSGYAQASVG